MAAIGCSNSNNNNSNYEKEISQNAEDPKTVVPVIAETPAIIEEKPELVVEDECPEKLYSVRYSDNIIVETSYKECEMGKKFSLVVKTKDNIVFHQDSTLLYVFNSHDYPTYIRDTNYEYILVERRNTTSLNKMDVFRLNKDGIDSIFSIPVFGNQGMDIDNDGITEYWAKLDSELELKSRRKVYNPIIAYEISESMLRFDSLITIELNKREYGKYYGTEIIDTLFFDNI